MQKYHQLKESLRSNFVKKQSDQAQPQPQTQTQLVDVEKIKNEIREEFRKKLASLTSDLN